MDIDTSFFRGVSITEFIYALNKRIRIGDLGYTEPGNQEFLALKNICNCLHVPCITEILQNFSPRNPIKIPISYC